MVVALVDDLMFGSKVQAACQAAGVEMTFARQSDAALAAVGAHPAATLVLDLDRDVLDPMRVIRTIRSSPDLAGVRITAFVRHTSVDRIKAAREAGAHVVLARSAFFPALPQILAEARAASPTAAAPADPS
jgi:CheY-like chemotaxis protein